MRNVEENQEEEEEYIDMEVSFSSSTSTTNSLLCYSPPSQTKEFEFQMTKPISQEKENYSKSPADELFYKGKLLPLHLPPRLQMVQKLLQNSTSTTTPFISTSTPLSTNTTTTPLESCNISPSESRRVSSELNPDDYFFEWSTELKGFIGDDSRKCWSKKLKLIKESSLCQKLKAFFSKKGCSDSKATCNNKYKEVMMKKHPTIANVMKSIDNEDGVSHRRSFSGAIKRRYAAVCSSSSSFSSTTSSASSSSSVSFNSSGFYELKFLKRSSSASSEIEGSIEAAIAHCKKSQDQKLNYSRNTLNQNETGKLMFPS